MLNENVILTKISNVISDVTFKVTDLNHSGLDITLSSTDAIYIGSELPFNSLYLRLGSKVNNNAASLNFAYYTGAEFTSFTRILDGTSTLSKSGIVNLIAKDTIAPSAQDTINIPDFAIDGYYGLYWTKITTSALLDEINLKYVGQLFVETDQAIYVEYPELANPQFFKAFGLVDGKNKIDWLDQRLLATDRVISDLISRGHVRSGSQFLDWRLMKDATLHKTAEIIYNSQGQRYKEDAIAANAAYILALENRKFGIVKTPTVVKSSEARMIRSARFIR